MRTRIHRRGDGCCLSWGWCNSWRITQSRTNRSMRCRLRFSVYPVGTVWLSPGTTRMIGHLVERAPVAERFVRKMQMLGEFSASRRHSHHSHPRCCSTTSSSELVLLATSFTPVVLGVRRCQGPATRVSNQPSLLASVHHWRKHLHRTQCSGLRSSASSGGTDFAHALPARRGS